MKTDKTCRMKADKLCRMKILVTAAAVACGVFGSQAQTADSDSLPTQDLQEIVIEAPKVIRKADMDVYHPSKSAVDNSKNGMQLINASSG